MQRPHLTNRVLMIRPANFGFNPETENDNAFQINDEQLDFNTIRQRAVAEFDHVVDTLRQYGIEVLVVDDTLHPVKTDAVFPNNWITLHNNGTVVTYPMFSESRRLEVREDIISELDQKFCVREVWRLEKEADTGQFLEGTGSMVLDRDQRLAFACQSKRTSEELLEKFCKKLNYCSVLFDATDSKGKPIYHTNVIMAACTSFVVICLEAIADIKQRNQVLKQIILSGKDVLDISFSQVKQFAGNMLQLERRDRKPLIVMSSKALNVLSPEQLKYIKGDSDIAAVDIPTIETYGGGSVRCMLAENFLHLKDE